MKNQVRHGNFEQVMLPHLDAAYNLALWLVRDPSIAEDVVQESLLRLWKKPEVLEQPSESARAWLFTVARNIVIDDRRSSRFSREFATEAVPERNVADAINPAVERTAVRNGALCWKDQTSFIVLES